MTPEIQRFIELLQRQLGYADKGSNTKFGEWYGSNVGFDADYSSAPWCDMYLSWAAHKLGYQAWIGQFAWTVAHAKWFKEQHAWGKVPTPGALVFFDWSGSGQIDDIDHVGVVTKVQGDTIFTIEGNIDGGVVERKERSTSSVVGYGYPEQVKSHLDATKSEPQLLQARPGPEAPQQGADNWSAEARPGSQTRQDQYAGQTSETSRVTHTTSHQPADSRPNADTTNDRPSDRAPHQPSGDHTGQRQPSGEHTGQTRPSGEHTGQERPSGDKTVQRPHDQNPQATDDHAPQTDGRPEADDPGRNTADGPGTHATAEPGRAAADGPGTGAANGPGTGAADGPGTGAADGSHSQGQSADPVSPGDNQDDPHSATARPAPTHPQASDSPPNATAPTPARDSADIPPATAAPTASSPDSPSASPTSDTPSTTPTPTSDTPTTTPTPTATPTATPTSETPSATATPTPTVSETSPTASATPTSDTPSTTASASASVPQTAPETTPSPTATTTEPTESATTAEPTESAASPEPEATASPTEAAATSQSEPTATPTPTTAPHPAEPLTSTAAEPVPEESTPAAPKAADTAFPTHLQASVSDPLASLSTPALVTSAVVAVVVLFAVLVVLKTRAGARSAATATATGYAPPSPPVPPMPVVPRHGVTEPDEGTAWRRELLEAIEAAVALDTTPSSDQDGAPAPSEQENRRPDPARGPQDEDALTEPLDAVTHTGPLESTADTRPLDPIVIPTATSPFNAFTPAESTDENVPDQARDGRSGHDDQHTGDEDATTRWTPPPPAPDAL
ncbi:CHAP domain-containing protein [Nonomuraea sp. NPDC005650]|uniref:CHAP domain-containing protein n=1 Tax=Nonomuraea sp. NPDC005650 TaxID=3157045 RepID=UPI0033AAA1E4